MELCLTQPAAPDKVALLVRTSIGKMVLSSVMVETVGQHPSSAPSLLSPLSWVSATTRQPRPTPTVI